MNTSLSTGKIVTISGRRGTGKSTVARIVAQKLGYKLLRSGIFYRALAALAIRERVPVKDTARMIELFMKYGERIHLINSQLMLDDTIIPESVLRATEVTDIITTVSSHKFIREGIIPKQELQVFGVSGLVAEGIEMGSIVFPSAPCKVFLKSDETVRVMREFNERTHKGDSGLDFRSIRQLITTRDAESDQLHGASLTPPVNSLIIDTSYLRVENIVEMILAFCKAKGLNLEAVA